MLRLRWTILFSLVIHLFILAIAALFFVDTAVEPPVLTKLVFELESVPAEPAPVEVPLPSVLLAEKSGEIPKTQPDVPETIAVAIPELKGIEHLAVQDTLLSPDLFDILTGNTDELREKQVRQNLLQNSLKENVHQKLDSIQTHRKILATRLSRFLMSSEQLKKLGTKHDAVESNQMTKNLGSNPGLVNVSGLVAGIGRSLSGVFSNREKQPMVGGAAGLPTLMEIEVLNYLWNKGEVTDLSLYSVLDTTYKITIADFNRILEVMARKGWLTRKKISPENILMIATPLGGIPVEMSAKNRRNPVYVYRPVLDKDAVMRALNRAIFNLEDSTRIGVDSVTKNHNITKETITRKIFKLLEN